jgi:hypothetical protein
MGSMTAGALPQSGNSTRDLGKSGIRGLFARAFGVSRVTDDLVVTVGNALFGEARELGRYRLGEELGAGGFGIVRAGFDPVLERPVAIKLLRRRESGTQGRVQSLAREARSLARVRHPNVVEVFDVGVADDGLFIVMQLVEGVPLSTWLREEKRSIAEIIAVFRDAAAGLAAIHAAGLLHRDFKPANLIIGSSVKIVDFGLAALLADEEDLTTRDEHDEITDERRRHAAGTPLYMAPEQHHGRRLDARADVYAFSLALLEALLGHRPFRARSLPSLVRAKLAEDYIDPEEVEGIPPAVAKAIAWGLRADPRKRCPSIARLVEAFEERKDRSGRVRWGATAVAAAVLLVGTAPASEAMPCDRELPWGDARERLATRLADEAGGVSGPVEDAIVARTDDWGARWLDARCEARLDPQVQRCLDREIAEFVAGLESLPTDHPAALAMIAETSDPSHCHVAQHDAEPDAEVTDLFHRAQLHSRTGDIDALAEDVEAIGDRVDDDTQRLAMVEQWRSVVARRRYDMDSERAHLERSYELARSARSDMLAYRAALQLASYHTFIAVDEAGSKHWLRVADAIAPVELGAMTLARRRHLDVRLAMHAGDYARVVEVGERALGELETAGLVRTPLAVDIRNTVIEGEIERGRLDDLEPRARAALDASIELRGAESYDTARARASLGRLLVQLDRLDEAAAELVQSRDRLLAMGEPLLLGQVHNTLAHVAAARDDLPTAIASYRAAFEFFRPEQRAERGLVLLNLAAAETGAGKIDDAEEHLDRGTELLDGVFDERHPWRAHVDDQRGKIAMQRKSWPDAASNFERAAIGYAERYGATNWMAADSWIGYAQAQLELGDAEAALVALRRAERAAGAPDSLLVALELCRVRALVKQHRAHEAESTLAQARDRYAGLDAKAAEHLRADLDAAERALDRIP